MDNIIKAGIKAGLISFLIVLAGILWIVFGWLYLPREQFIWFFMTYSLVNLFAYIVAGILSGIFATTYVHDVKESFKPGLVAGIVMSVITVALSFLLIALGVFVGRGDLMLAMIGLGILFFTIIKIFVSALLSAAYIIVAHRATITTKFE